MEIGNFKRDFTRMFNPDSIAVVGASNSLGKWGFMIPMNIIGGGYRGELLMVNSNEDNVLGFPTFRTLSDIKRQVDLVVVTIPARKVEAVVEEAASIGAKNMLVVSSNFSEAGGEGTELERKLALTANEHEITIIGPNTMGIFSASSSLCALGTPVYPPTGRVGFISQSGNLGVQLLDWGKYRGVGFSRFIGCGNGANTGIAEYLEFLGEDHLTEIIVLYVEGMQEGRRLLEAAENITPRKPIIVLKGGTGEQGSKAAMSHSGAMAGSMELYHGMVEQAGMIPVETSEELIDLATAFSSLPLPRGDRVVVVTMGGGWGVVAADACDREGVNLAALPDDLVKELDTFLPEFWSRRNPVDLVGNLRRSDQLHAIDTIMKNDEIDLLIMMGTMLGKEFFWHNLVLAVLRPLYQLVLKNIPRLPGVVQALVRGFKKSVSERQVEQSREGSAGINLAEAWLWTDYSLVTHLNRLIAATGKPIISVAMTESQKEKSGRMEGSGILTTQTPERAVYAASKLSKYSAYVKRNGRRA